VGTSILSDRSARRIARSVGLEITRAWGHGSYVHTFVTPEHRHGWYSVKSGEWGWEAEPPVHKTSCGELFPDWVPEPVPPRDPGAEATAAAAAEQRSAERTAGIFARALARRAQHAG
jgi:hypothetical protein